MEVSDQLYALAALLPGQMPLVTHWIRFWVRSSSGLDGMEKCTLFTLPGVELQLLGRPARSLCPYRLC
jgi:hypothetical protein